MTEQPGQGSAHSTSMIHISNEDVLDLLTMDEAMTALRIGFQEFASRNAAHVPRMELWSPTTSADAYYCLGSMAGTTKHFGVTALRIKSDVISWPNGRQQKYAVDEGTYCGFIILFSNDNGAPIAMINDGIVQRMRVGASAGIGADLLAVPWAATVGILGSGDMARSYLEAIALVRALTHVKVYSPNQANRESFAAEMSDRLSITVEPVKTAGEAASAAEIVVTATNSMTPTIDPKWVASGSIVLCVSRREVGSELVEDVDSVYQLGEFTIGEGATVPGLEFPQSGAGGFVAGNEVERARLPWRHQAERRSFPSLIDIMSGVSPGRLRDDEKVLYINTGLQGVQFAAVAGRLYQLARENGAGEPLNQSRFLQDVRD